MNSEYTILLISWIITTALLVIAVPKNRIREGWIVFVFIQVMSWLAGLIVVEMRFIEYPIRFFHYANRTSFTFEFFVYPSFGSIFNLNYPCKKEIYIKGLYYASFIALLTIIEILIERYTQLITYIRWNWYMSAISFYITFQFSRMFYVWFFMKPNGNIYSCKK